MSLFSLFVAKVIALVASVFIMMPGISTPAVGLNASTSASAQQDVRGASRGIPIKTASTGVMQLGDEISDFTLEYPSYVEYTSDASSHLHCTGQKNLSQKQANIPYPTSL